jgi:hypothetical protein
MAGTQCLTAVNNNSDIYGGVILALKSDLEGQSHFRTMGIPSLENNLVWWYKPSDAQQHNNKNHNICIQQNQML